jgi:hypothetical protein
MIQYIRWQNVKRHYIMEWYEIIQHDSWWYIDTIKNIQHDSWWYAMILDDSMISYDTNWFNVIWCHRDTQQFAMMLWYPGLLAQLGNHLPQAGSCVYWKKVSSLNLSLSKMANNFTFTYQSIKLVICSLIHWPWSNLEYDVLRSSNHGSPLWTHLN